MVLVLIIILLQLVIYYKFTSISWKGMVSYKMFKFVNQILVSAMIFFGDNISDLNSLKCVSVNNQECKIWSEIININRNEPLFYPDSIKVNKCSGSCNNINDPYSRMCVPDLVKNINVKLFNLMLGTNKTRHIKWHKTSKRKCQLDSSVCNNKQRWNNDKCRCECTELIDEEKCGKEFIRNPRNRGIFRLRKL